MKRNLFSVTIILSLFSFTGCEDDYDEYDNSWFVNNEEKMELTVSAASVKLNEEKLSDEVLTFSWTSARVMPEGYKVSYVTMLDLKSNQFGTSTVIRNLENEGVFSRSYTTEQLQNYITQNWGQSVSEEVTLSFKVIAKWDSEEKYIMPEVRTADVNVMPYKPLVFDADIVYVSGSAKTGVSQQIVSRTLENEYLYAIVTNLKPGQLTIPVTYDGMTQYIAPVSDGAFKDGEPVEAKMIAAADDGAAPEEAGWEITGNGEYRVVIDMLNKKVTIYSPENEFNEPLIITWYPNNDENKGKVTTEINTETLDYYTSDTWGWKDLAGVTQSLADPRILVYSGEALKGGQIKFVIGNGGVTDTGEEWTVNNCYCFSSELLDPDTSRDVSVIAGQWTPMSGGSSSAQRNSYFNKVSGMNFIVFDFRNMRIKAESR